VSGCALPESKYCSTSSTWKRIRGGAAEGWPGWIQRQVSEADKVLVIASAGWFRCYEGEEVPGSGLGAAVETNIIAQRLYNSAGRNEDIRVVVFNPN